MTRNPYNPPAHSKEASPQVVVRRSPIWIVFLRLFASSTLPVPLIVVADAVVLDVFYMNRLDPEYVGLFDSYAAGYLLPDFMLHFVICSVILGLPLIAYSATLVVACKTNICAFFASLFFGATTNLVMFYYGIRSFGMDSPWEFAESCVQFLVPVVVLLGVAVFIKYFITDCKKTWAPWT